MHLARKQINISILILIFSSIGFSTRAKLSDSLYAGAKLSEHHDTAYVNQLIEITQNYLSSNERNTPDSIFENGLRVIELSKELNYQDGIGKGNLLLGKSYLHIANYPKSLEYFYNALKLFQNENSVRGVADAKLQIGLLAYLQNNFIQAIHIFSESLKLYRSLNDSLRMATIQYLTGLSLIQTGHYPLAKINLEEAMDIKMRLNSIQGVMECKMGLAVLYTKINDEAKAISYFNECEAYWTGVNYSPSALILINTGRGDLYRTKDDLQKARNYYIEAYKICIANNDYDLIVKCTPPLAEVFASLNDYENAYKYQTIFIKARDSIFSAEKARAIANLEAGFNLEKKQTEIDLLNKQKQFDQIIKYGLLAGVGAVLIILFILYNRIQLKKKNMEQLFIVNNELEKTLKNLQATQEQLLSSEKLASLGRLTSGIAHEIQNPLNFVNNFSSLSKELIDEITEAKTEDERNEALQFLKQNVEKIEFHGKRADSIVKNMLAHSRSGSGEKLLTNVNALTDEFANLAFHGMRSLSSDFVCQIRKDFDQRIPLISMVSQDISRVLLNLITNAFHAVDEKAKSGLFENYVPTVTVSTKLVNKMVHIIIEDNGTGIPENIREKIFEPFFTTKPTGVGTGLGLSLSYDIIKTHNGEILVDTKPGEGTAFTITLPV